METIFSLPFSDTPATDSFTFPCCGNVLLNGSCIKVSGWKWIFCLLEIAFQTFLPVIVFFCLVQTYFSTNPSFWLVKTDLVETIFFQFLKFPFHWREFFDLAEISFKRILYYCQWPLIFCLMVTKFFYSYVFYFFETIITVRGRPIF